MGALKVGVLVFFVLAAIGGHIYTHPSVIDKVHVQVGETTTWTNANFSAAASDPQSHMGEKVDLKAMVFNEMPKDGRIDKNAMEIEAYMGSASQLRANPMDTSKRIYVSYDQGSINYVPVMGQCIEIKGKIAGVVSLTTMDGSKLYPLYIKAESISVIPCSSVSQ
jgi:hypothetical protein